MSLISPNQRARIEDIEHLLRLYHLVYAKNYPLAFGTDPEAARKLIESQNDLWIVERDPQTGRPVASVLFDVDPLNRIGKITGLVVHPDFRGAGLASRLIELGTDALLGPEGKVNSIYTTTRTNAVSPQLIFLRNRYLPLGIFPNAHKLKEYETLTLFAKFRDGVLERRAPVEWVPEDLGGLLQILKDSHGIGTSTRLVPPPKTAESSGTLSFELIHATSFVKRCFENSVADEYDRFYPFHQPNLLIASTDGTVEIFAYFSAQDRYCAITSLNVPVYNLAGKMGDLLNQLKDHGISYVELLLGLEYGRSIDAALDAGFIPSAIYPAMRQNPKTGQMEDFVVLSRTLESLNFRGMAIHQAFKPYVDQYIKLWTRKALESLKIHRDHQKELRKEQGK